MNFGTPVPLLIGIVLILGAVALFFLDKLKPGYGRDTDKVYAILWLISGIFLLGHLTMELLASFQQVLMAGMLITVTIENILSRTPKEDRYVAPSGGDARRDYARPSRPPGYSSGPRMNVRARLDNEDPYRNRFPEERPRLSGREEMEPRRYYNEDYLDRYSDDRVERSVDSPERPVGRLNPSSERIRRRRPRSTSGRFDAFAPEPTWDESASGYSANSDYSANGGYSANSGGYSAHSSGAQPSAYPDNGRNDGDSYVDYRPVNRDDESDRPPSPSRY